jgi:hypothetical protein
MPSICCVQRVELTEKAVEFLKWVFTSFDIDGVSEASSHRGKSPLERLDFYTSYIFNLHFQYLSCAVLKSRSFLSLFFSYWLCSSSFASYILFCYADLKPLNFQLNCFSISGAYQPRTVHSGRKSWRSYSQQPPPGEVYLFIVNWSSLSLCVSIAIVTSDRLFRCYFLHASLQFLSYVGSLAFMSVFCPGPVSLSFVPFQKS